MKKTSFFAVFILVAVMAFAQDAGPTNVTVETDVGSLDIGITVRVVSDSAQQQAVQQQQQNVPAQQQQQYVPAQQPQQYAPAQQQNVQGYSTEELEAEEAAPKQPYPRRQFFALELGFAVPVHLYHSEYYDSKAFIDKDGEVVQDDALFDKKPSFNLAANIAVLYNFTPMLAFTIDGDLFYNTMIYGTKAEKEISATLFGTDILVAPVFTFYNGSRSRAAFAAGFHMYYADETIFFKALASTPTGFRFAEFTNQTTDLQLGLGGYLGFQQHMSDNVYIFGRLNFSIDPFRWVTTTAEGGVTTADIDGYPDPDAEVQSFFNLNGSIKPVFGIGVKF